MINTACYYTLELADTGSLMRSYLSLDCARVDHEGAAKALTMGFAFNETEELGFSIHTSRHGVRTCTDVDHKILGHALSEVDDDYIHGRW